MVPNDVEISWVEEPECGTLECGDYAWGMVNGPGMGKEKEVTNGCPSEVWIYAPKKPDGTVPAVAHAYGNGNVPERSWGWITTPGWEAGAKSSAHKKLIVRNETVTVVTVYWLMIWIPVHPDYFVVVFDEQADGEVYVNHKFENVTEGTTLIDSNSYFTATSPNSVMDSTGLLEWERFTYGEYENAFRPVEPCEPIVLEECYMELGPYETVEIVYSMTSESGASYVTGDGIVGCQVTGHEGCAESMPSDFNNDCVVDFEDFAYVGDAWLDEGVPWPLSNGQGY